MKNKENLTFHFVSNGLDNILKGFATSVSIILSCLCSYVVFNDLSLDLTFVLGTALVIGATFIYGLQSHQAAMPVAVSNSTSDLIDDEDDESDGQSARPSPYTKVSHDRTYQKLSNNAV